MKGAYSIDRGANAWLQLCFFVTLVLICGSWCLDAPSRQSLPYIPMTAQDSRLVETASTDSSFGSTNDPAEMETYLIRKYRISLAKEGERIYVNDGPGLWGVSEGAVSRTPTVRELSNLKFALEHSDGSQLISINSASPGLKICFLKTRYCHRALADWVIENNGRPALLWEPYTDGSLTDRKMQAVFLHELAHNAAFRMGYKPSSPETWKLASQLGWKALYNPLTDEAIWAMYSSQGYLYKWNAKFTHWVRCDQQGQPLNAEGSRVSRACDADLKTVEQMSGDARIRPVSRYFPNPMEMLAEGLMFFRLDAFSRAELANKSPKLYSIVASFDQCELDKCYGKGAYKRSAEGVVAAGLNAATTH